MIFNLDAKSLEPKENLVDFNAISWHGNTTKQRLLNKTKKNYKTNCWEWQGTVTGNNGYGSMRIPKQQTAYVHRLSYVLFKEKIPLGNKVLHKCDNPPCCNTEHLFIGTQKDNMQDALKKMRLKPLFCPTNKKARGEKNGMFIHRAKFTGSNNSNAKLDDTQRDLICSFKSEGFTANSLAEKFNISESQVLRITRSRGIKRRPLKWTEKQRESIMSARRGKTTKHAIADALLIAERDLCGPRCVHEILPLDDLVAPWYLGRVWFLLVEEDVWISVNCCHFVYCLLFCFFSL